MIIAEVEVLEKLDSPFIIKYFEFFKYDDDEEKSSHMCISTEYCNVSLNLILIISLLLYQNNFKK